MKLLRRKTQHFHRKLPCQKLMLRQIEWGVQNGPFPKNGVLPITNLLFWKFYFSIKASYRELIWCTNYPNVHIHTVCNRRSFVWGCFFPVSILKRTLPLRIGSAAFGQSTLSDKREHRVQVFKSFFLFLFSKTRTWSRRGLFLYFFQLPLVVHGQLWSNVEGTTSVNQCLSLHSIFDREPRNDVDFLSPAKNIGNLRI